MSQLALFPAPPKRSRHEVLWDLAYSPEVQAVVLAILAARPNEWLEWRDFKPVIEKFNIGCCLGHLLHHLKTAGRLAAKNIYYGAERPGMDTEYLGYNTVYMHQEGVTE